MIVCVDDEPGVLRALERLLRKEPYELLTTTHPRQALEWIRRRDVSLVIADYEMPGMDGIDLLLAVQEASPSTERLMLTAHARDPLVLSGQSQELLTLAAKPWEGDRLKAVIRELLLQRSRLERQIQDISELERRRLGQDFHDTLGQNLVGLALLCKSLESKLRSRGAEEVADMEKIAELAQRTLAATRALARGANPPDLSGNALPACLKKMAASVIDSFKVDCRIEWVPDVVLRHPLAATQVYWIIHEALTNALRHANARHILIEATRRPEGARIRVCDDGRGLSDRLPEAAGIGLRIMKARARRINATLSVERSPAGGTQVVCDLPDVEVAARPE